MSIEQAHEDQEDERVDGEIDGDQDPPLAVAEQVHVGEQEDRRDEEEAEPVHGGDINERQAEAEQPFRLQRLPPEFGG